MLEEITKLKIDERVKDSFSRKRSGPFYSKFRYCMANLEEINCFVTYEDITAWEQAFYRTLCAYIPDDIHCFVAGGSVLTYILYGNELLIRDYDIFVKNQDDYDRIKNHLTAIMDEQNKKDIKTSRNFENENAKHFSFGYIEIDLVKKFAPSLDTLLKKFDIDLCQVGFDVKNHHFNFLSKVVLNAIFERTFTIQFANLNFKKDGVMVLQRILKYISKGFKIKHSCLMSFYASSLIAFTETKTKEQYDALKIELSEQVGKAYSLLPGLEFDDVPAVTTIP